jgi:RNA polymerase primary sigma factor
MRAFKITQNITRRDEQSLEKYFAEIVKFDVLTPEEELELFQQYKNGDESALEKIINHNLRFVVSVSKRYQNLGIWLGDLINEGNLGLIRAAKRFDETRGFKFISYAVWWIRQSIIESINQKGRSIRVPSNVSGSTVKVNSKTSNLLQEKEREPTIEELAEATGLSKTQIKQALVAFQRPRSFDAPINNDSDTSLVYLIEDTEIVAPDFGLAVEESQQIEVQNLLKDLPKKQISILKMYFGIGQNNPMTLSDIGKKNGMSREKARQIKDRALRKLRSRVKSQQLTFSMT